MRRPLHTLKIWGAGVNSPPSYGAKFNFFCLSVFLFVCPSRYDARHRKPRRCVYALNLGGTGISPPDSFSYPSSFRFRSRFRSNFRSSFSFSFSFRFSYRSSSSYTTSGDIFYCSGSRQLNHSSCHCCCRRKSMSDERTAITYSSAGELHVVHVVHTNSFE